MRERFDIIRDHCRDKTCLDVGIVGDLDHHLRAPEKWVFNHIGAVARELVGLDLDADALAVLRRKGHSNLVCGDAERFAFTRTFDVIVAGELIEHLANPGRFLAECRRHLVPEGLLMMTTPNTFAVNYLVKGLLFGHVELFHDHVNAYTPPLLTELLRRHGFGVIQLEYFTERNPGLKNRVFRLLSHLRPTWSEGIFIAARVDGTGPSA